MRTQTAPETVPQVSVIGVGSYLPEHRVSNEEILKYLQQARARWQIARAGVGGPAFGHS